MSFGFSVGDFIAVAKLIKHITSIVGHGPSEQYQSLSLELHALQRALHAIEHINAPTGREIAINSIKVAALMCQHPLEEFSAKLRKYAVLDPSSSNRDDRVRLLTTKVNWKLRMEDDVRNLRAYLIAHVGSLNMRLMTEGL
jgi:hypothetical protein